MDFEDLIVTGADILGSAIGAAWAYQADLQERRLRQRS